MGSIFTSKLDVVQRSYKICRFSQCSRGKNHCVLTCDAYTSGASAHHQSTELTLTTITRRQLLNRAATLAGGTMIATRLSPVLAAERVIKVGTLKLIHGITPYFYSKFAPAGYTVEVIPFESPTDGKNAVLTGTVDTCIHGIAAFYLGAAAGEPVVIVANATNRGMAIISGAKSDIKSIKELKGKKVAIWPGSTQEVVILERLKMEGMSIKDIQPIRLSFSDMAAALARGDIDAYVGAEPGPGISLADGTGRLIEYPYSTPIGSLNMILSASEKMIKQDPERIKMIVKMHEQATDYAMAHPEEMIQVAMQKLGQQRKPIEIAVPN